MIRVDVYNAHPRRRVRKQTVARYVSRVLRDERLRRADIGVIAIDTRMCRRMNRQYLSHDYSTDVISFPLTAENGKRLEGEIYVNLDKAHEQARTYGVTAAQEIARLIVHGTLHLAGYDDRRRKEARRMRERENRYVQLLFGRGRGTKDR